MVAKRSGAAGYYAANCYGRSYTTRYMHLRKILVKPGQKVKRGDRIALSGNTGRSTGPHLHYEVWINQQAVNPLTAKLPRTEGLTGSDRRDSVKASRDIVLQLRFDQLTSIQPVRSQYRLFLFGAGQVAPLHYHQIDFCLIRNWKSMETKKIERIHS
ncbi:peptidoglycan DD-metalloendopeptidase family protein [Escherichia coli]